MVMSGEGQEEVYGEQIIEGVHLHQHIVATVATPPS